jgi:unsaturated rhamnogalacturonyl hydrolase
MKSLTISFAFLLVTLSSSYSQSASGTWAVKFSDAIISRYTPTINAMTSKGWEYSNTIILHGMEKVYNQLPAASYTAYLNYIKAYADAYVNTDGTFKAGVTLVSLDRIHPGISLLFLYEKTGLSQYATAATTLRNVLVGPTASYNPYRTPLKKIFWHKQSGYDNIMMLDGIYMAHPFLAKYGRMFNDAAAIDTAVNQALFAYNQLFVAGPKLIKHAWKEPGSSGTVSWADGAGNSTSVWSRAMGWYTMALVDILKYVPPAHPKRPQLLAALSNLCAGIKTYQDAATGLWYQVVDKTSATLAGNYLETSGSSMFVYSLKVACDSGWISSATYMPVAVAGWNGVKSKINNYTDGMPRINDFAPAMSVQNTEALYVQASLQSVDCPVSAGTQHPHGYAGVLMAASVMEFPLSALPVHFISFTAKDLTNKVRLIWESGTEEQLDHYEIQRSTNGSDFKTIGSVPATAASKYSWDDNNRENRLAYYRIKAISLDGSANYSSILPVSGKQSGQSLLISPNPVIDGNLTMVINAIPAGKYNLKLLSSTGELVQTKILTIQDQGSTVFSLPLSAVTGKGVYYLQLDGNGILINKSVLIK